MDHTGSIRDQRRQPFFWVSHQTFRRYAHRAGPIAWTVYCCLVHHSGPEGTSFPTIRTIAEESGISDSSVKRAIKKLTDLGMISVEHRYKPDSSEPTSNLYTLLDTDTGGFTDNPPSGGGNDGDDYVGSTGTHPGFTEEHKQEPIEQSITESNDSVLPRDLFNAFLDVRNQTWNDYDRKREIPRFMKLAKELVESGITEADITGCTLWLEGQRSWRTTPTSWVMVGSKVREWIREGRPSGGGEVSARSGGTGREEGRQQSGFSYDQWVRDNPPSWAAGILGASGGED